MFLLVTKNPLYRNSISEFNVIFRGLICNEFRSVHFLESLTNTEVYMSGFMHTYIVFILWEPTLHSMAPSENIELVS